MSQRRRTHPAPLLAFAAALLTAAAACTRDQSARPSATPTDSTQLPAPTPPPPTPLTITSEPWSLDGDPGRVLVTPHYRLSTTLTDPRRAELLATLLESSLTHYRRGCGALDSASLPEPTRPLEVFIYRTRGQWERATRQLLGEQAGPMLAMPRGGYTIGGRTMLYDLGPRDTMLLLAHEGWHQYMQSTFAGSLPEWLDEGLATIMEGQRWESSSAGAGIAFRAWANTERFDELRRLRDGHRLWTLDRIIAGTATTNALSAGQADESLAFYAQAWALTHFLMQDGIQRAQLASLLQQTAAGESGAVRKSTPVDLFRSTLGPVGEVEPAFHTFVLDLTRPGSREKIVQGISPVSPRSDPR